jgi:hypothetical protein
MLALNSSLLNREYILIKCSEGFGFDHFYEQSPCNRSIEDYTEVFSTIYKWNISSIRSKMRHRWTTIAREVDPLRLIFINFGFPAFTPGLHSAETALELSNNKSFLAICRI